MKANLIEKRIKDIENWLELNEGQMFFESMKQEQIINEREVSNQKKILDLLKKTKHS